MRITTTCLTHSEIRDTIPVSELGYFGASAVHVDLTLNENENWLAMLVQLDFGFDGGVEMTECAELTAERAKSITPETLETLCMKLQRAGLQKIREQPQTCDDEGHEDWPCAVMTSSFCRDICEEVLGAGLIWTPYA